MRRFQKIAVLCLVAAILVGLLPPIAVRGLMIKADSANSRYRDATLRLLDGSSAFSGGNGTVSNPYLVATAQDLQNLSSYSGKYFRQICDISMEGLTVTPVNSFTGSYDGGGFTISDLTISCTNKLYVGLFGQNSGVVKNVTLENAKVSVSATYYTIYCGAVVGYNTGTVNNCAASATVTADTRASGMKQYTGGAVGYNTGTITDCVFSGSVQGAVHYNSSTVYVGGIVGYSLGNLTNCKNSGSVTADATAISDAYAGGIAAYCNKTVTNCFNEGEVQAIDARNTFSGGVVAYSLGTLIGTKNTGHIYGNSCHEVEDGPSQYTYCGGIAGYSKGKISYGENSGYIEATSTCGHTEAGGIAGYNGAGYTDTGSYIVEYSRNSGDVLATSTGGQSTAGGIAGTSYKNSYVRYCCNTGKVSVTENKKYNLAMAGGLVGTLMYATMLQCCNHGDIYVNATHYDVIGCGLTFSTEAVILDCYNEGNLHSDFRAPVSYYYNILAGLFYDCDTTCENCYNLGTLTTKHSSSRIYGIYGERGGTDRNSISNLYTTRLYNSPKGVLISQEQATQQETFVGFDFENIWGIDPDINGGHPYLKNLPDDDALGWYIDPADIVPVTGVYLNVSNVYVVMGNSINLFATVQPVDARDKYITWSSDNPSVAQVSSDGKVTAKSAGTTMVRVTTRDGGYQSICTVTVSAYTPSFSGGTGTQNDPYLVANANDLINMVYLPKAHYLQVADISMEGYVHHPAGDADMPFSGSFNGNGFVISNLTLDASNTPYLGLFGYSTGTIKNVIMGQVTVVGYSTLGDVYCGGIVAYNAGTVKDCTVRGDISASARWEQQDAYAGGICGYSGTSLSNCAFNGTVNAKVSFLDSYAYAGGVVGYGMGAANCRNYGRVTASAAASCDSYAAGILGYSSGAVSNCYNAGEIRSTNARRSFAAGICGKNTANVTSCKNVGTIYAHTAYNDENDALYALAGGICGSNFATVSYGWNEGFIEADSTSSHAYAGGVVGYNNANCILENSVNYGDITAGSTGGESRAGGIASSTYMDSYVRYCCNHGNVSITDNPYYWSGCVGGVVAVLQYGTVMQCCNHGDVSIDSTAYEPHGASIVGSCTDAVLKDCYSDGNVHSYFSRNETYNNGVIAGIAGGNGTAISNCYFTGTLTSDYSYTEKWGVVKQWGGTEHTLSNLYVLNLYSSTQSQFRMTDAASKLQSTYSGFDFSSVWAIDPSVNGGRPYLRNLPFENSASWYSGTEEITFVAGVSLNSDYLEMHIGDQLVLEYSILPAASTDTRVHWHSDWEDVVTVDQNGIITAHNSGMATVTVTTLDGAFTAECLVYVADHDYTAEITPPTCTEQGYTIYTCVLCEDRYLADYVSATGHSFGVWYTVTEGTCTEKGSERRDCANCVHFEEREVAALGHALMQHEAKAPTCTEIGWNAYETCSRCDYSTYAELPATGHNYEAVVTAPTCTEQGYTTYTCHCGNSYVADYVSALGHMEAIDAAVAATCTTTGLTEGKHCSVCKEILISQQVIPATGHNYEAAVTEPTCTVQGYTTHTCSVCGDSYVDSYTNAFGHDWNAGVVTIEPTEETAGEKLYTCNRCGETSTEVIPTLDHVHRYDAVVTEPTCTQQGHTTHTCRCGDSYVDNYVAALGHELGAWYTITEATCTEKGSERRDCGNCEHFEEQEVAVLGHALTQHEAKAPTCTDIGWVAYETCERCDYSTYVEISATGHSYETVVTAPTCTAQGFTTYTCHCGQSYADDYVDALGHREVIDAAVAATCTTTGMTEGKHCSVCKEILTAQQVIPAMGHSYESVVTKPTCTAQGYTTYTCHCGDSYVDSYTNALGHDWDAGVVTVEPTEETAGEKLYTCNRCGETRTEVLPTLDHVHRYDAVVTEPTCTEQGYTTHTCRCGDSYVDSYMAALGHDLGAWYTVTDATCTENGLECRDCSRCDHYETRAIAASGHNYESVVTEPTCTEQGYTTHTCTICGDHYVDGYVSETGHSFGAWYITVAASCTESGSERRDCGNCEHFEEQEVAALGHALTQHEAKAPTCTEIGWNAYETCFRCDYSTYAELPATGHSYEAVVTAPTCTAQGFTTYTCSTCGDTYVDHYVDALGHTEVIDTAVAATCTTTGLTEGKHCAVCKETLTAQQVIPATGHSYETVVTAPTCTAQGYTTHTCSICGDSYLDDYVAALGHDLGAWYTVTEPTCTEKGSERRDCANCDHFEVQEIAELDHNFVPTVYPPTCTESGFTSWICHCGANYVSDSTAPSGHDYVAEVTAPSCVAQGYTTYTCRVCGDNYKADFTPVSGHSYGEWIVSKAPTCTEDGTQYCECSGCGRRINAMLNAAGHDYEAVVTEPTWETGGYTTYICRVCGHSYQDDFTDPLPYIPGDADGDGTVNTDDAIYLLYNVMFGDEDYPVNQECDFDGNGTVNTDDAIYLLYHVMFGGEDYPLLNN